MSLSLVARSAFYLILMAVYAYLLTGMYRDRKRILALARHTFVESLRQKVLIVPLLFMAVVIGTSAFSAAFREVGRVRIVASSCLWSLTVFGMVVAILLSARGIPEDITDRTIYSVITKPVRRSSYLTGKILGFSAVALLILAIMGTASLLMIRWVGRNTRLEALRTISKGELSVEGAGVERRDGAEWIVHQPSSTLRWRFTNLPELARDETALARLRFKGTAADPKQPLAVLVEFKNANDRTRYERIADAKKGKDTVVDLPGVFVTKGTLDVIAVPVNGQDVIGDDQDAVVVSAAKKDYTADEVLRRANSWAAWRFSKLPAIGKNDKIGISLSLNVRGAGKKDSIKARVRVNPRGGLGPPIDVSVVKDRPVAIELSHSGITADGRPVPLAEADRAYFGELVRKLIDDAARAVDIAVLPLDVGDSYEIARDAVQMTVAGRTLEADHVRPQGYGLLPTTRTQWFSRQLQRTAICRFTGLDPAELPRDEMRAVGHFKIGKNRTIDIDLTVVNPSQPDLRETIPVRAVRDDPFRVGAKPVEFSFSRKYVDAKGRLDVVIERKDLGTILALPYEDCIVLYARPGSYDVNFFSALTVIFFQIVLITAISVASSTSLSWPVSILISFFVFFCGHIIDIMRNAAEILNPYGGHHHHGHGLPEPGAFVRVLNKIIEVVLGILSYILPDFRKFEVADDVIHNRAIAGISIGGAIAYAGIYVAIAFGVAYVLFRRREIE